MVVLERAARGVPYLHTQAGVAFNAFEHHGVRRGSRSGGQVIAGCRKGANLLVGIAVGRAEYCKFDRRVAVLRVLPHGVAEHHPFVERFVEIELQIVVAQVASSAVVPVRRPVSGRVVVYQQTVISAFGRRRLVTRNLPCIQYQVLLIIAPARIIGRRRHGQARRMGVGPVQAARKRHGPKRQTA